MVVDTSIRKDTTSIVEQEVIQAVCRDGVPARVQRVAYEGQGGGECFFGHRIVPGAAVFDKSGLRNESGDLWKLDGAWKDNGMEHPFDLISKIISAATPKMQHAHA